MPSFLLELFSEEIPARMQREAAADLYKGIGGLLIATAGLNIQSAKTYVTPRRLAFTCELPVSIPASETELKGPKVGVPEVAVQGFLKKNDLKQSDLTERDGVYFAIVRKEGRNTADILKLVIEDILADFPWPKSMRWGSGSVSWVRPLHSIVCIFDGKVVPVEFAGIKAGNVTYGHRFLAPQAITIGKPEEYEAALEKAFVIADADKRRATIEAAASAAAKAKNLAVKKDQGLLDEVTGLVEWPTVLMGQIDAKYMDLPPEVLTSEMRAHQKYFALIPSPSGRGPG